MDKKMLDSLVGMDYALLKDAQLKRLREMEKQFNIEFDTNVYFMVMNKVEQ